MCRFTDATADAPIPFGEVPAGREVIVAVTVPISGRGYGVTFAPRQTATGATVTGGGHGYGDVRDAIQGYRRDTRRYVIAEDAVFIDYSVRADQPDRFDNPFTMPLSKVCVG
jgi:hypothetical protein